MTLLSRLLALFPALVILMAIISFGAWVMTGHGWWIIILLFDLYVFPLLIYRIHHYFYPIKPGISYLVGGDYSPWWGTHQIQLIYSTFPTLERVLHLIPGLFSLWLRLWGSSIGKNIYWTPSIHILDRGLLIIGDRVVFGHQVTLVSHSIKPKRNNLMLYVDDITIGNDVFISAGVGIGPGVKIGDRRYVPFAKKLFPGEKFDND